MRVNWAGLTDGIVSFDKSTSIFYVIFKINFIFTIVFTCSFFAVLLNIFLLKSEFALNDWVLHQNPSQLEARFSKVGRSEMEFAS